MQNYSSKKLADLYGQKLAEKDNIAQAIDNQAIAEYLEKHRITSEQDAILITHFVKDEVLVERALNDIFSVRKQLSNDAVCFLMNNKTGKKFLCDRYSSFDLPTKLCILKCSDNDLKAELVTSESYLD